MEKSCFITLHCVMNKPGNPVKETRFRTTVLDVFGVCEDAMTQIGAACCIQTPAGVFYSTESTEEVAALIEAAEKGIAS